MARKPRPYEQVCNCSAYKFPHRFSGGKCEGKRVVADTWDEGAGYDGECRDCPSKNTEFGYPFCEVLEGGEPAKQCPAWQAYVRFHGIRIYKKAS